VEEFWQLIRIFDRSFDRALEQQSLKEKDHNNISGWGPGIFGYHWFWYLIGLKLNVISNLCKCPPGIYLQIDISYFFLH